MGFNTNRIKARAEELLEGYQDARDEEFSNQLKDFMSEYLDHQAVNEDDLQGFIDNFEFPNEDEWAFDEVQSELDDIGDQQYEQMKDERMGL